MRGTRWPDANRTKTATSYLKRASLLRQELVKGKRGGELREAREVTEGLRFTKENLGEQTLDRLPADTLAVPGVSRHLRDAIAKAEGR